MSTKLTNDDYSAIITIIQLAQVMVYEIDDLVENTLKIPERTVVLRLSEKLPDITSTMYTNFKGDNLDLLVNLTNQLSNRLSVSNPASKVKLICVINEAICSLIKLCPIVTQIAGIDKYIEVNRIIRNIGTSVRFDTQDEATKFYQEIKKLVDEGNTSYDLLITNCNIES